MRAARKGEAQPASPDVAARVGSDTLVAIRTARKRWVEDAPPSMRGLLNADNGREGDPHGTADS